MLGIKLLEECCKYGVENIEDKILVKVVFIYGDVCKYMEKE